MSSEPIPSLESLSAERAWIRALARCLLRDDATADDVVQQTWLAFLRSPPHRPDRLRGWLRQVLKNEVRQHLRTEGRRRDREKSAAASADASPVPEIVSQAETQLLVAQAVMELREPYRSTVLLRYFEDLSISRVAERLEVPVETARTRLKRAHAMLRARLDSRFGRDGRSWGLALLPLAGVGLDTLRAAPSLSAPALTGGLLMTVKSAGSLAAVAALGACLLTLLISNALRAPSPTPPEPATAVAEAHPEETPPAPDHRPTDAEWLTKRFAVPAPPRGSGIITGRVRRTDGRPLAGVRVRAWTRRGDWGVPKQVQESDSLEAHVHRAVANHRFSESANRSTFTDDRGEFILTGLLPQRYELRPEDEGYVIRPAGRTWSFHPGDRAEFIARRMLGIHVTVLGPDGTPPKRATVIWGDEEGEEGRHPWSADRSVLRVRPGTWLVHAEGGDETRGGNAGSRSTGEVVEVTEESAIPRIVLRLAGRTGVRGTVRFHPDALYRGATVRLLRTDAKTPPGWPEFSAEKRSIGLAADRGLSFEFLDLEPGRYWLGASSTHMAIDAGVFVEVENGIVEQDLPFPPPDPRKSILVRVEGPDGRPVSDAQVQGGIISEGGYASGSGSARTATGIRLHHYEYLAPNWTRVVSHLIIVDSRRYGRRVVEYRAGEAAEATIRYEHPAHLELSVPGYAGSEHAGSFAVRIDPVRKEGPLPFGGTFQRGPAGNQRLTAGSALRFGPLSPGEYEVRLLTVVDGIAEWVAARTRTTLSSGMNRLSLALPPLHSLRVSVPDDVQGKVRLYSVVRREFWNWNVAGCHPAVLPSADGIATFHRVPAGRYIVVLPGTASKSDMLIDVPSSGTVEFEPAALDALEITITDPEGVLGAAGARTGDRIVAVNRETFESRGRFLALVSGNRESDSVALSLERAGVRTIIHIPGQTLIYGYHLGARLTYMRR